MALLEVKDLHTYFKTRRGIVKAVFGVSYSVDAGRTLGIVGESGSGKSTLLGLLRGLHIPRAGVELTVDGTSKKDFRRKGITHQ